MSKSIKILADGRKMIHFHLSDVSELGLQRQALAYDQRLALTQDLFDPDCNLVEQDPLHAVFESCSESHLSTYLRF